MIFNYHGNIENLTMFGYDFSEGQADVGDAHFIKKLKKLPDFEAVPGAPEESTKKELTAKEIKALLDEKGIEYKVNASKPDLMLLLEQANDQDATD